MSTTKRNEHYKMQLLSQTSINAIAAQYRETAEWADLEPFGTVVAIWSSEAIEQAKKTIETFLRLDQVQDIITELGLTWEDIGHNLWLSRNGHGTGFWDRGWGDKGKTLHQLAKEMGEQSVYISDDDEIFFD